MTEKEYEAQKALGTLPEEYKIDLVRYRGTFTSKGRRKCSICGLKCIEPGAKYCFVSFTGNFFHKSDAYINICMDCIWLPYETVKRIEETNKTKESKNERRTGRFPDSEKNYPGEQVEHAQ